MEVIMYTMKGCLHCNNLKKFLNERKISFIEKDIEDHEPEYEKFSKAVKSEYLPAVLIGKKAFLPEKSFKTIIQASRIIESYLAGLSHHGHHLG